MSKHGDVEVLCYALLCVFPVYAPEGLLSGSARYILAGWYWPSILLGADAKRIVPALWRHGPLEYLFGPSAEGSCA